MSRFQTRRQRMSTYFGAPLVVLVSILVFGLIALFLTDDFWVILGVMAVGAFPGLTIQAGLERSHTRQ